MESRRSTPFKHLQTGRRHLLGYIWPYSKAKVELNLSSKTHEAVIFASCYCDEVKRMRSRTDIHVNSACIMHETCEIEIDKALTPTMTFLSPHQEPYYLPTKLPPRATKRSEESQVSLCVVGSTRRRDFKELAATLQNINPGSLILKVFGFGDHSLLEDIYEKDLTAWVETYELGTFEGALLRAIERARER